MMDEVIGHLKGKGYMERQRTTVRNDGETGKGFLAVFSQFFFSPKSHTGYEIVETMISLVNGAGTTFSLSS